MSDLLDQIRSKLADAADKPKRHGPPLPPEAAQHYSKLQDLHPGAVIEVERRIVLRVYDSQNEFLCIDVRNLPDQ